MEIDFGRQFPSQFVELTYAIASRELWGGQVDDVCFERGCVTILLSPSRVSRLFSSQHSRSVVQICQLCRSGGRRVLHDAEGRPATPPPLPCRRQPGFTFFLFLLY